MVFFKPELRFHFNIFFKKWGFFSLRNQCCLATLRYLLQMMFSITLSWLNKLHNINDMNFDARQIMSL